METTRREHVERMSTLRAEIEGFNDKELEDWVSKLNAEQVGVVRNAARLPFSYRKLDTQITDAAVLMPETVKEGELDLYKLKAVVLRANDETSRKILNLLPPEEEG